MKERIISNFIVQVFSKNQRQNFFKIVKKNHFGVTFDHFLPSTIFSKKSGLPCATPLGTLIPYYISEKTNMSIPRKLTDRRAEGKNNLYS